MGREIQQRIIEKSEIINYVLSGHKYSLEWNTFIKSLKGFSSMIYHRRDQKVIVFVEPQTDVAEFRDLAYREMETRLGGKVGDYEWISISPHVITIQINTAEPSRHVTIEFHRGGPAQEDV